MLQIKNMKNSKHLDTVYCQSQFENNEILSGYIWKLILDDGILSNINLESLECEDNSTSFQIKHNQKKFKITVEEV